VRDRGLNAEYGYDREEEIIVDADVDDYDVDLMLTSICDLFSGRIMVSTSISRRSMSSTLTALSAQ
jgi:hypothetical protein